MKPMSFILLVRLAAVFSCLGVTFAVGAEGPVVIREVPRSAFVVLQALAAHGGLNVSDPEFLRLPEIDRPMARQRYDGYQKQLIGAVGAADWPADSKRNFIDAVTTEDAFTIEVHPLARPGFKPAPLTLKGRLTPTNRERLRALRPAPAAAGKGQP